MVSIVGRKVQYNNITSQDLLDRVNKNNIRLGEDFLEYLKSIQRSESTINAYRSDLNIFWVYCLQNLDNKNFIDITKRDIVKFQNWCIYDNKNSSSRVRRLKACISSLSNYVENILDEEEEFAGFRSIVRKIENPPQERRLEKSVWNDDELNYLLDELCSLEKYEQACFVALAMYGGRRKSELTRFKVSDFGEDKLVCDGALYKSDPIKTKGRASGKYIPCYTLAKKFKPYFDLWMGQRDLLGIQSEWLFPKSTDFNEHIDPSTITSWSNTCSNILGKPFYPHSLRHYYVSSLSRAGIPENVITQIVGWDSAEMCSIYNDNPADDQIARYFKDGDLYAPTNTNISDL